MKINTYIGEFTIRDGFDREVIREVIEEDQYRRWGDIQFHKGGVVIDLGAHIGSFTKLAAVNGATVIAVEPFPGNQELLIQNTWDVKDQIVYVKAACLDGKDAYLLVDPVRNELHKLMATNSPELMVVPTVSLDRLISKFGPEIDLLKLDVEGSEYPILYSSNLLDRVKQITMEWHYGSTKMAELIIYLEQWGFKTVWEGGNGDWGHLQFKRL